MALETVVYPQGPLGYGCKEFYSLDSTGAGWGCEGDFVFPEEDRSLVGILDNENMESGLNGLRDSSSPSTMQNNGKEYWDPNSSAEEAACTGEGSPPVEPPPLPATTGRRKRRRTRSCKNREEMESQRMTHIAVERNRRKQMNEYLAVIRSLIPPPYVQRGDQASIIGGAINFVKELEQLLQSLEARKRSTQRQQPKNGSSPLFADFFSFPQYSTSCSHDRDNSTPAENRSTALAEIEVTMMESHANLKVLSKKRPRQLLKIVGGLQCLRLTILHLNVTTVDQMVLYSLSVKVEEGCQLTAVDEIADAVNQLLGRIEEEAALS